MIQFVTKWRFQAPIEKVWEEVTDVISYPAKWPTWRETVLRGSESKVQIGSVIDCVGRGVLPFSVSFTSEITTFQPPTLMEYASSGGLVGNGRWVLTPNGNGTDVISYWDFGLPTPIFSFLSKLPFAKSLMAKHHDYVMAEGYRGFQARLE